MKKRIAVTLLSAVFTLTGAATLTACFNNTGSGDKANDNKDFVAYRKKVVSVLKDNGIFVNDLDASTAQSDANGTSTAVAAAYYENSDAIRNIITDSNPDHDFEGAANSREDIFSQTLNLSLVIGDAMSNFYGEKNLYDIPVYFEEWNQYFVIVKSGNNDLVRCYTPESEYQSDSVLTMELEYTSATDYSFTCMQIWDDQQIYAYGNAQKEYIMLSRGQATDDNFIRYTPDDGSGYYCTSADAVNQCYELVKDAVEAVDAAPIKALKDNVRYSFTQEQSSKTLDKYFKDRGLGSAERIGIQYSDIGGKKVAVGFVTENETRVEIPKGVEYISDSFIIEDTNGTVKELYIPSSVVAVINQENGEVIPASGMRLEVVDGKNGNLLKIIEKVTVQNGSTVFTSGTGSLYDADGALVYLADYPLDEWTPAILTDEVIHNVEQGLYTHLFDNITQIDLEITKDNRSMLSILSERIFPAMKALETVNLSGNFTEHLDTDPICFTVNRTLTVNCDFECSWEQYGGFPLLRICFFAGTENTATVNLKGISRIDSVYSEGVNVTVNLEAPEVLYTSLYVNPPQAEGNVQLIYSQSDLTEEQARIFTYQIHSRSGKTEMKAVLNYQEELQSVSVPGKVGLEITALEIWDTQVQKVELTDAVRYILIEYFTPDRPLTIKYDGTIAEFENNVQIICYAENYSYTLECSDGSKQISGQFNAPEEELCTITITLINGETQTVKNARLGHELVLEEIFGYDLINSYPTDPEIPYVLFDGEDTFFDFHSYRITPTKDAEFTMVKLRGRDFRQDINLSKDGFKIKGEIFWLNSGGTIEGSTTYNGENCYCSDNIYVKRENVFYADSKITDPEGNPIGQYSYVVTFKLSVDADGYLAVDIDTVTANI